MTEKNPKTENGRKAQAAKPETNGRAVTDGLRKPQVRILAALVGAGAPLSRAEISGQADVDLPTVGFQAGYVNREINAQSVNSGNLLNRGYVTLATPGDGPAAYAITDAGRKALAAAVLAGK